MCAPRIRTIHIERILGGLTRQNKSENAKTNLLWSPSTTADINFFRFPTRVARGIFGTRRVPRFSHPFYILRMVVYIPGGAAHMRSINYADSATKTAREREGILMVVSYVTSLSFSSSLVHLLSELFFFGFPRRGSIISLRFLIVLSKEG